MQFCAQGLILRENGYACEGGILYFIGSRKRVSIPFDDALVDRTRELLAGMREMGVSGVMPAPLDDSPKCPRCSLVGICLPDETTLLREGPGADESCRVRKLLPARQDALPLYVQEQGAWLGKSGDELTVKLKGELLTKVRLIDTSQVSLLGNVQMSAQALREITSRGIPVCHFSYGGWFHGMASLFKADEPFNVENRNRRPPRDPVNALLSFVYALLVKELTVALVSAGFDPMLGFYHQPRYGRPSLALDLAEEYRPLIGDSVVLTLINNGEVSPKDFIRRAGGIALTQAGRKAVMAGFERRMDTLVTHPIFKYRISYRRILEVQARLLARVLLGEIEAYPSFCTR